MFPNLSRILTPFEQDINPFRKKKQNGLEYAAQDVAVPEEEQTVPQDYTSLRKIIDPNYESSPTIDTTPQDHYINDESGEEDSIDEESDDLDLTDGNKVTQPSRTPFESAYSTLRDVEPGPRAKAYTDFVEKTPTRDQYKPGKMARLGAILSGIGGESSQSIRNIMDSKYNRAVDDFKLRAGGMKASADLEERESGRKVSLARTISNSEHQKALEDQRKEELKFKYDKLDVDSKNAMKRAMKAGMKYEKDETTGEGFFIIPKTDEDGEVIGTTKVSAGKVGESISEKVKREINKFSQESAITEGRQKRVIGVQSEETRETQKQRIEEEGNKAKEVEGVRQGNRKETEEQRQENRVDIENQRIEGRVRVNKERPSSGSTQSETQKKQGRLNTITKAVTDADNIAKAKAQGLNLDDFVTRNKAGQIIDIKKPEGYWSTSKKVAAEKLYKKLSQLANQ